MLLKALTLSMVVGVALGLGQMSPKFKEDHTLLEFMLKSRALVANPELSQYCFNRYLPVLDDISAQYRIDFNKCVDTYTAQVAIIDTAYVADRANITERAENTCNELQECDKRERTLEFFDCYNEIANDESKNLQHISADASIFGSQLRDYYRQVESEADFCVILAERTYVENSRNTYEELNECLDGNIKDETTKTTPRPTTTESTSTYADSTSEITYSTW